MMSQHWVVLSLLLCCASLINAKYGSFELRGCSEAFVHLNCDDDDTIDAVETKIEQGLAGTACASTSVSSLPAVPSNMMHICPSASECLFVQNMCQGSRECVFYVNPNLALGTPENQAKATSGSKVTVNYQCKAGTNRRATAGGLLAVGAILLIVALGLIVLISYRMMSQESYDGFIGADSRRPSTRSTAQVVDENKNDGAGYGESKT